MDHRWLANTISALYSAIMSLKAADAVQFGLWRRLPSEIFDLGYLSGILYCDFGSLLDAVDFGLADA